MKCLSARRPRVALRATPRAALVSATLAAALITPATAAAAGWTSATAVQSGVNPVLTFSPTGAAVVGSQLTAHGRPSGAEIDLASNGQSFAASPFQLAAPIAGHGAEALSGLVLSSGGYLAVSFANPTAAAPVLVRVAPPAPSQFAKVEQLVPLGPAASGQSTPDTLSFTATTSGEIVGAGVDDAGDLYTATLASKQTSFRTSSGPKGLAATDAYGLATDADGNTVLAGDGPDGCSTVAFRPAQGHFARTYATGNCSSGTPNIFDAITATGNGNAALLTEDVSEAGLVANRLLVQVGHDGHFARATQLGGALGGPVGLASDADGEFTVEWSNCDTGALVGGRISTFDCDIDATTGSVSAGVRASAARGTTLVRHTPGVALSADTADRAVAVSRCHTRSECGFEVFTAKPGGGFRAGHALGTGRTLIALTGDVHGDLLVVWSDSTGAVWAATGSAATGRWSSDTRLTATAINPATVTALYGPHRRALVAWSTATKTYATGFTL